MRRNAAHPLVVGTGEVAAARAFDLDHARAQVGELARAERARRSRVRGDDGDAVQGAAIIKNSWIGRGCARPRRCWYRSGWSRSAPPGTAASRGTCARRRIRRRSRSRRGLQAGVGGFPGRLGRQVLGHVGLAPQGWCASNSRAAFQRIRLAASTSMKASAIGNCTPWFWPIGRSKTTRSLAYFVARSMNQ